MYNGRCVGVCKVNVNTLVCEGCLRTVGEITEAGIEHFKRIEERANADEKERL